jgi:RNA polymerase sigma-70 factor (ECF subfamily)
MCRPGQADDVTQAVFLALWHSPASFGPGEGSLRPRLVDEAHRRAVDLRRADTARRAREAAIPADELEKKVADELEKKVLANAAGDVVASLLAGLPKTERQAIILTFYGGYTRRQVATLVHRPAETVNADILTGVSRLHANLPAGAQQRPLPEWPAQLGSNAPQA